jgi:hypothetical protein
MADRIEVTFPLPKGCDIETITIRETTGKDEAQAALNSRAKGKHGVFVDEMIRLSIAKVDGKEVEQPFNDIEEWSSKTRAWVLKGYFKVNGTTEEDESSFFENAVASKGSKAGVTLAEIFTKGS